MPISVCAANALPFVLSNCPACSSSYPCPSWSSALPPSGGHHILYMSPCSLHGLWWSHQQVKRGMTLWISYSPVPHSRRMCDWHTKHCHPKTLLPSPKLCICSASEVLSGAVLSLTPPALLWHIRSSVPTSHGINVHLYRR